ncbi:MAG TPA: TetR/AcrR family transcriptional regulator [Acidimicrobiales bacterium]|nr:TetR/AcrR family transcriptional regulator [Acidimicrobiales bacterium]
MDLKGSDSPVTQPKISELRHRLPAAQRRSQLLDVAIERFAAGGFHATSMDDIADAAGVTKPVLYQHFHSKRQLYRELLDTVGQELLEAVATSAAAETAPFRRVLAGFCAYFKFVRDKTAGFQLLFGSGARRTDEFADSVRKLEESVAATIGSFIDADIEGEHRHLLGYAIVGLAEVAGRHWVTQSEAGDAKLSKAEGDRLAQQLADFAWAGLRGLPGGATREGTGS